MIGVSFFFGGLPTYPSHCHLHQLEADLYANDPQAIKQADGTYLFVGPKGRLESWEERQSRLQHNLKMQFNRSVESSYLATLIGGWKFWVWLPIEIYII